MNSQKHKLRRGGQDAKNRLNEVFTKLPIRSQISSHERYRYADQ